MIDQLLMFLERKAWARFPGKWTRALATPFRVTMTVARGLYEDELWLHAGYMSYLSLLHLVPLGGLALAVSTRLGWKAALMNWVETSLSPTAPALARKFVMAMDRFDLAALGYLGLASIIIAGAFSVSQLEDDLRAVWHTRAERTAWQRILLYPAAIILIPAMVALVLAFGTIAEARTTLWIQGLANWGQFGEWLYGTLIKLPLLFRITPYALSWLMLTMVYWLGPPAPVKFRSAMLGGLVGAVLWQAAQNGYLHFQFATSTYREIWGYLIQLPLLLTWIYASWVTLYIGAEFTFAWQHRRAHMPKMPLLKALRAHDEFNAAIRIASDVAKSQTPDSESTYAPEISGRCRLPLQLVEHVAERLTDAGIFRVFRRRRKMGYTVGDDVGKMTVGTLIDRYRSAPHRSGMEQSSHSIMRPDTLVIDVGETPPARG